MKNNKAFTLVELLIVIAILALIAGLVIPLIGVTKLLTYIFGYFSIPAIILFGALMLNRKYKWLVNKQYGYYKLMNKTLIDKDVVVFNMWIFFIFWPIYTPIILAIVVGREVYNRYLKNIISIPNDE